MAIVSGIPQLPDKAAAEPLERQLRETAATPAERKQDARANGSHPEPFDQRVVPRFDQRGPDEIDHDVTQRVDGIADRAQPRDPCQDATVARLLIDPA